MLSGIMPVSQASTCASFPTVTVTVLHDVFVAWYVAERCRQEV